MIDPARFVSTDRSVDDITIFQGEEKRVIGLVVLARRQLHRLFPREPSPGVFDYSGALANRSSRINASPMNAGPAHFDPAFDGPARFLFACRCCRHAHKIVSPTRAGRKGLERRNYRAADSPFAVQTRVWGGRAQQIKCKRKEARDEKDHPEKTQRCEDRHVNAVGAKASGSLADEEESHATDELGQCRGGEQAHENVCHATDEKISGQSQDDEKIDGGDEEREIIHGRVIFTEPNEQRPGCQAFRGIRLTDARGRSSSAMLRTDV
jgi:hypothetical protein